MSGLELQTCTAGRWHGAPPLLVSGIGNDTRSLRAGEAYVALRGPRFDGHAFGADAAGRNAAALIGDAQGVGVWVDIDLPILEVEDTQLALGHIAGRWREQFSCDVVAITGSYGKTTLRSMLEHVLLAQGRRVTATRSNDNNLIGVPQTLLRMDEHDDVAVVECGISEAGEMRLLAAMVQPDVAVITGISSAHGEGLGGLQGIAAEKARLLGGLSADGCAILGPGVSGLLAGDILKSVAHRIDMDDAQGEAVQWSMQSCRVQLRANGVSVDFDLPLPARHWAADAALCATILQRIGVADLQAIGAALATWQTVGGRMHSLVCQGGSRLLDDSYNANPASMAAALDTLRGLSGRRIAVLGDMAELGPDTDALHAGLDISGLDVVLLLGDAMRALAARSGTYGGTDVRHMNSVAEVLQALAKLKPEAGDTLLVKASRCMHLEDVVNAMQECDDAV
ncbi:MAG: UDP-N-acetylmuramoyl-tripeptide--D-alanyl-D-alanine ligase [Mariprofundaceae bacterium]|nr:UDP-N-acetylmuramoyl-tripeptide--D-alanyl-D-alanine ligase [Mariprofundaceae bacterium]